MLLILLYACSTRKVPKGEYLLTKNNFEFTDAKLFADRVPNFVSQKPNSKVALSFYLVPLQLWIYNLANPKYDTILNEYNTYPNNMKNQKLRDSLFVKYGHPEYIGKSLWRDRTLHFFGQAPVILDQSKTTKSAKAIEDFLTYKGYWDAHVKYNHKLDSAAKKATANYIITNNDPTYIKDYFYDIPYDNIKNIYEQTVNESFVKSGKILDQENLEKEVKRLNDLMRERGYYSFNRTNEEVSFTADTLKSTKQVPITLEIKKQDSTKYKQTTIGNVDVYILENPIDTTNIKKETYKGINFYKRENNYKNKTFWSPILVESGKIYEPKALELTKRNLIALNNFSIVNSNSEKLRNAPNDSILDVRYILKPLPRYQIKGAFDVHYSQILNFGFSPSVELTTRNVFGGAENLGISFSGIIGTTKNSEDPSKNKFFNAYELSAQANLSVPRLMMPYVSNILPKRYSPSTIINLGTSIQNNIGLGRINFNGGINYNLNINDRVSHRFTLLNTQFSFTQNKDKYYDYFPRDGEIAHEMFALYFASNPAAATQFLQGMSIDELSKMVLSDEAFLSTLTGNNADLLTLFKQSLLNKDRQTQDVIISSFIYNFIYNEIGKKDFKNPFSINIKAEFAGNIFSLFNTKEAEVGIIDNPKTIFKIPYSQFAKFDIDVRKYFTFFNEKHTLALRQFIGIGIPYGNSSQMPFVRSYFNGGSYDIRAWRAFSGLGPSDSQVDVRIRSYIMDNIKLTSSIEYRFPINKMFHGAVFTDAGNIWSLKDNGIGDQFKFNKFISQMGVGSGFGLRINIAYMTLRMDLAYQMYDPNMPQGERWRISKIKLLQPTWNFAFGYPF